MEGEIRKIDGRISITNKTGNLGRLRFVTKVSELTLNTLGKNHGVRLNIESDVPAGSGLGSSSAVTTATAAAISTALDKKLDRDEISRIAYEAEKGVQGAASRTGVSVASHGGFLRVQKEDRERLKDLPELNVLIGYTGKHGNTGKLVAGVRKLKESHPEIINPIMEAIGKITEVGIESLREDRLEKVGVLMDANQNLLEGLRVSSSELWGLISAARSAGALGAKLTGGGGGGCMIALNITEIDEMYKSIEKAGGKPIEAKIGAEGLVY